MIHANLCQTDPRVPCRDLDLQGNPWNTPDPRSASCPAPAVHAWSAQRPASEPWKPRWPAARTNTTERHMGDRQNAIQQNPVLSRKVSVLGIRWIGLHGLVCHAVTFACWFEFKPWGWGWLVVSLQKRGASFRIVLKRIFSLRFGWCRTSWIRWYSKYPLISYYISAAQWLTFPCLCLCMKISYHFIFFARHWMGVGSPGDPKVNFWVSVGYRSGYRAGECLGPGNFDNRTCAVQEHASTTFDAAGSAERFFALLCATHANNRTVFTTHPSG